MDGSSGGADNGNHQPGAYPEKYAGVPGVPGRTEKGSRVETAEPIDLPVENKKKMETDTDEISEKFIRTWNDWFVAPSFGCATEPYHTAFLNAQKKFREMGHPLDLGPNCYADCGIGISNTPEACGRELTEYYCSDKNEVLISCGGGELMCETLDAVDFEQIRAAVPKWYMGYSDNTNMTYLLATLSAIPHRSTARVRRRSAWSRGIRVFRMHMHFCADRSIR